jgi:hypothetical protein
LNHCSFHYLQALSAYATRSHNLFAQLVRLNKTRTLKANTKPVALHEAAPTGLNK